jgi:DNA-binding MarR family transcriptional regulator
VKDVDQSLRLDPATLSPLLKRLKALGYLTRRSTADKRTLVVELTPSSIDLRRKAEKIPPAVSARLGMEVPGSWSCITPSAGSSPLPTPCRRQRAQLRQPQPDIRRAAQGSTATTTCRAW